MRFLVDTNVFLWGLQDDRRLSPRARDELLSADNELLLSIGSFWEITIKASLGALDVPLPLSRFFQEQLLLWRMSMLPITLAQLDIVHDLPWHHRDPFDRLIVAQAKAESVPLLTADRQLGRYGVEVVW